MNGYILVALALLGWRAGWWWAHAARRKGVQIHERWLADDPLFVDDLEAAIRAAAARNRKEP